MSKLISIVYRPKGAQTLPDGYTRVPVTRAELVAGVGIKGDAKGGGTERNLNIMSAETLQTLEGEGFIVEPGKMGEQLIFEGLDVSSLPKGARLQVGDTAQVVLTIPRTGCAKFERNQGKLRQSVAGRLGMMARVEVGGPIAVGDPVTVMNS